MKKRGFTLIELLVVILILGILITLGSRGIRAAKLNAKKAQAMVEMKSIETAVKAYQNKYGKLPVPAAMQGQPEPSSDEALSRGVVGVLTGDNEVLNRSDIVFLEPQGSSTNIGAFLDPWGEQYRIALDTDYNDEILYDGEPVRRTVAVLSIGLYLKNNSEDEADLIKSWE